VPATLSPVLRPGAAFAVAISDTAQAIELDDNETRVVRRTTTTPVRNIEADQPWTVTSVRRTVGKA